MAIDTIQIGIIIGIMVAALIYQDAKQRNYKHIWIVTALGLLLNLIGYVIWMIVRRNYPKVNDADSLKFNKLESLGLANTWSFKKLIKYYLLAVVFAIILIFIVVSVSWVKMK
ncbi:MAG: hypothetical protein O8C64_13620 [Candidatus Methanoperedens sp.]|nr:hypothetical protein [Candidatus Methanoperedens sp.]MCZ7403757.1 hypothetical protein [Candidatus Methanoperedens sp.]